MHPNEISINESIVKGLLHSQFPQWDNLPLKQIQSSATDHAIYRLGDKFCIRLPRLPGNSAKIEKEHHWLPLLAPHLPLDIPVPIAKGSPGDEIIPGIGPSFNG